jgi:RNA polymerase sigma-70 factor (ECF subfamily)
VSSFDRQAFRELFERQREPLFRFLHRLTRNSSDADDLLQETFLTIWRKREQFRGEGSIEGWVRRTAYRVYLNARERDTRRATLAPVSSEPRVESACSAAAPDVELGRREAIDYLVRRVHAAADELPDGAREAFLLFRCEGWTCAEIAHATETPVKTVETRLARATKLLAERLRGYKSNVPAW